MRGLVWRDVHGPVLPRLVDKERYPVILCIIGKKPRDGVPNPFRNYKTGPCLVGQTLKIMAKFCCHLPRLVKKMIGSRVWSNLLCKYSINIYLHSSMWPAVPLWIIQKLHIKGKTLFSLCSTIDRYFAFICGKHYKFFAIKTQSGLDQMRGSSYIFVL